MFKNLLDLRLILWFRDKNMWLRLENNFPSCQGEMGEKKVFQCSFLDNIQHWVDHNNTLEQPLKLN